MSTEEAPPIIDISGMKSSHLDKAILSLTFLSPAFYRNDDTAKRSLIDQVRSACKTFGFLQIVNHNVPDYLQEDILRQSEDFFNLPLETKEKYNKGGNNSSNPDDASGPFEGYNADAATQ
jgi:isopenicillin N synthase-like dioxygenase